MCALSIQVTMCLPTHIHIFIMCEERVERERERDETERANLVSLGNK